NRKMLPCSEDVAELEIHNFDVFGLCQGDYFFRCHIWSRETVYWFREYSYVTWLDKRPASEKNRRLNVNSNEHANLLGEREISFFLRKFSGISVLLPHFSAHPSLNCPFLRKV